MTKRERGWRWHHGGGGTMVVVARSDKEADGHWENSHNHVVKVKLFSIKHDLARSCFQLWPKMGDKDDKISRKKTGEALAETVFSRNL